MTQPRKTAFSVLIPYVLISLTIVLLATAIAFATDPPSIDRANARHVVATYQMSYTVTVYNDATLEMSTPVWTDLSDTAPQTQPPAHAAQSSTTPQDSYPGQCAATAKSTGNRCRCKALPGSAYCRHHPNGPPHQP